MMRIDSATRAVDLFGPGKHGFKDGNTLLGDPSTTLNASMFNHLQEEIARCVEAFGGTLDPTKYDQLATVLGALTRTYGPVGNQMLPGGLLLQWCRYLTTSAGGVGTFVHPDSFKTAKLLTIVSVAGTATNPSSSFTASWDDVSDLNPLVSTRVASRVNGVLALANVQVFVLGT
ncbi:hypothetical protein FBZ84_103462 [Azospirillum baldaniorum]|uniref:hypothetical protein n=1 Tax=Azospirillum baldaniorum TaxID=1064539 RepID=UPI0011A04D95|nr:hypothetical protein [Azospirillum baldaniorum]TWA69745.1 hypothetical protein FBZ84_103462 [Azospirillum baldaniorum]